MSTRRKAMNHHPPAEKEVRRSEASTSFGSLPRERIGCNKLSALAQHVREL